MHGASGLGKALSASGIALYNRKDQDRDDGHPATIIARHHIGKFLLF